MKPAVFPKYRVFLLVASVCLLLHSEAGMAQAFPCPQGPGPGQQQVGSSGGSHGVAAVPMCVNAGDAGASQASHYTGPAPIHTAHWVLAIGSGSDGRSAYVLAADPVFEEDAEKIVFRRCKSAGIRACRIERRFNAGVFALAEAANGGFVHAIYPYPQLTSEIRQAKKALKEAEKAIVEACVQQTGGTCKVREIRPSNEWSGYDQ